MSWPRNSPVICISCPSGSWGFCRYVALLVFQTDFLQIVPFSLAGHDIIVINLTIIEFYYKTDICLWLWQEACPFVIIISSQPAGAMESDTAQMTVCLTGLDVCVCVCVCMCVMSGLRWTRKGRRKWPLCTKFIQWPSGSSQEMTTPGLMNSSTSCQTSSVNWFRKE